MTIWASLQPIRAKLYRHDIREWDKDITRLSRQPLKYLDSLVSCTSALLFTLSHIAHFFSFTQSKEDDVSELHFVWYRLCYVFLIIKIVMLCGIILAKTIFLSLHFHVIPLWSLIFFSTTFSPYPGKCVLFFSQPLHQRRKLHRW